MRTLIMILVLLSQLINVSASRAENNLLGLDADLENFTSGIFFYKILRQLDSEEGSTALFMAARKRVETALRQHRISFQGLPLERQRAIIEGIRESSQTARAGKRHFYRDENRTEVYGSLVRWGRGRLAGLIEDYTSRWQQAMEREKRMAQRQRRTTKLSRPKCGIDILHPNEVLRFDKPGSNDRPCTVYDHAWPMFVTEGKQEKSNETQDSQT